MSSGLLFLTHFLFPQLPPQLNTDPLVYLPLRALLGLFRPQDALSYVLSPCPLPALLFPLDASLPLFFLYSRPSPFVSSLRRSRSAINLGLEYEPTSAELLAFRDEILAALKIEEEEMRRAEMDSDEEKGRGVAGGSH